jgi:hypothetical protein
VSIDFEDVAYEDSVSCDSWLEEAYEDQQSGSLWSDPCESWEEAPEEYVDMPVPAGEDES